jgi:hypothetical protein
MSDGRFYLVVNCPRCDDEVFIGPVLTMVEHRGLPVVPADMATQEHLECDECGLEFYTPGEFELDYDEGQPDHRGFEDDEAGEV